jgi:transcriptional regulator with XRE-family HTH domain
VCHVPPRVRLGELPADRRRGARITDARLKLGLSQDQLAQLVGVKRGSVNRWEGGDGMRVERVQPLADVLNVDPEWIVGGPVPPMPPRPAAVDSVTGGTRRRWQIDEIQALLEILAREVAELAARGTEQPPEERIRRLLEEAARLAARRT